MIAAQVGLTTSRFITDFIKLKRVDLININLDKRSVVFKIDSTRGFQTFFSGKRYCEVFQ